MYDTFLIIREKNFYLYLRIQFYDKELEEGLKNC